METEPRRNTSYDRPLRKRFPKLRKHKPELSSPDYLRSVVKQGRHGAAPFKGYATATEGSNWIIKCAQKKVIDLYGFWFGEDWKT
jgi:hypothetical protein